MSDTKLDARLLLAANWLTGWRGNTQQKEAYFEEKEIETARRFLAALDAIPSTAPRPDVAGVVTDEMVEAGCNAFHGDDWKRENEEEGKDPVRDVWLSIQRTEIRQIIEAALRTQPVDEWLRIGIESESAPRNGAVLLGWWDYLDGKTYWNTEVAWAGGKNWTHRWATHWRPLPAPPQTDKDKTHE